MNEKQARLEAIERQIQRLQRRLHFLDGQSNRLGWTRVGIFFSGAGLSVLAYFLVGWWLLITCAAVTIIVFSIAVYFHQRLNRSITRHTILERIKLTQVARIRLDWERIPPPRFNDARQEHPFEIDLDITGRHSLHQLLDTASSAEGSQRLREWLLATTPDAQIIQKRQALISELAPLVLFRDRVSMKSIVAARNQGQLWDGKRLLNWLNQRRATPALLPLLFVSLALSTSTIILLVLNIFALIPPYWIIALLLNIIYLFVTKDQRGDTFEDAHFISDSFAHLSAIFEYLESYRYGGHQQLKELCRPFFVAQDLKPSTLLNRVARVASAASLQKNMLLWLVVNVLVPWDFYFAYRFNQYRNKIAGRLPLWLDTWFELEALHSLATFAYLNPEYTLPQITECSARDVQPVLHASGLGHPLLPVEQKVVNDFSMPKVGEIAIITGSNMSGKSTFLRTLGINLCLAYAGGPVNASLLHTSLFRLFTCIKISDSVTDGYSYFYAEVRRLKALLNAIDSSEQPQEMPLFFLIDEIFKGTNNRERLIGSESYISALAEHNCLGVISTHDLELVKLEDKLPGIKNYHFREDVIDGNMVFDYTLREGPCPTTNALKIMQLEGLPINLTTSDWK
ncbi:MAG: MutS-related protein [Ktedonobacteraceae bacterium]